MSQREKSLHVIINFSIRAKDEIEGWGGFLVTVTHAEAMPKLLGLISSMEVELWRIDGEEYPLLELWMELMSWWKSPTLKDCLRSKGSKVEVVLDLEVVEDYSLVDEMGVGPSRWVSNSWEAVSK